MYRYCYSTFAIALAEAAIRKDRIMLPMANDLIGFLTEKPEVCKMKDGEDFIINPSYASRWFKGTEHIPISIQSAAGDKTFLPDAIKAIGLFTAEHLYPNKLDEVCNALYIPASEVATPSDKRVLKEYLDSHENEKFLAIALMTALTQENCLVSKKATKERSSLKEEVDYINYILKHFHKPTVILMPSHSTASEMQYVEALLQAIADETGVISVTEDDINSKVEYRPYKFAFDKQRKAYYQAESIREATRDSEIFCDEKLSFSGLMEEIHTKTQSTYDAAYPSGYQRMLAVTDKAATLSLNSLLAQKLKWVNQEIKRGTIHVIINEEGEGWVSENDRK